MSRSEPPSSRLAQNRRRFGVRAGAGDEHLGAERLSPRTRVATQNA